MKLNKDYMESKSEKRSYISIITKVLSVFVIIGIIAITGIVIMGLDNVQKYDENGNPICLEFTEDDYYDMDKYIGRYVRIKGKVGAGVERVLKNDGAQVYLDPAEKNKRVIVYYDHEYTDKFDYDDYVIVEGYIDNTRTIKSNFAGVTQLYKLPIINATLVEQSTYIDVEAPTISMYEFDDMQQTFNDVTVAIEKIEFALNEVRVYVSVDNQSESSIAAGMYYHIVQNGKQHKAYSNYKAEYKELENKILPGVKDNGVITFSEIEEESFKLYMDINYYDLYSNQSEYAFEIQIKK